MGQKWIGNLGFANFYEKYSLLFTYPMTTSVHLHLVFYPDPIAP